MTGAGPQVITTKSSGGTRFSSKILWAVVGWKHARKATLSRANLKAPVNLIGIPLSLSLVSVSNPRRF
jgi:hypothetical protein